MESGAVFEEKQGWERPGWFLKKGTAPVQKYDWYGSYGTPHNQETQYENLLKGDHTFGFSKHHHMARHYFYILSIYTIFILYYMLTRNIFQFNKLNMN